MNATNPLWRVLQRTHDSSIRVEVAQKTPHGAVFIALPLTTSTTPTFCQSTNSAGGQWRQACWLFHLPAVCRLERSVVTLNAALSACEKGNQWQMATVLLHRGSTSLSLDSGTAKGCELAESRPQFL